MTYKSIQELSTPEAEQQAQVRTASQAHSLTVNTIKPARQPPIVAC